MPGIVRLSISLEKPLLDQLERLVKAAGTRIARNTSAT